MGMHASLTVILLVAALVTGQARGPTSESPQQHSHPQCCTQPNNAKHFFITSPELQESSVSCLYHISQNSSSVCYLSITLHYFSVGSSSQHQPYYCDNDFLEISGVRLCGCWNDILMIVNVMNRNTTFRLNMKSSFSQGFVIEVQQEECTEPMEVNSLFPGFPSVFTSDNFSSQYYARVLNDSSTCLNEPINKTQLISSLNLEQCQALPIPPTPSPSPSSRRNTANSNNPFILPIPIISLVIYYFSLGM